MGGPFGALEQSMKSDSFLSATRCVACVFVALLLCTAVAFAKTGETIILNFDATNGMVPLAGLISDQAGNLYGTSSVGGSGMCADFGGARGCGTVFELSLVNGTWTQSVLYSFQGENDGIAPAGSLISDAAGNLYGTTEVGGGSPNCVNGCGTVFELSPPAAAGGAWSETVLYRFKGEKNARTPLGNLVFDAQGDLYGTTLYGGGIVECGGYGCGTVFELEPPLKPGRLWRERLIHHFLGKPGSRDGSGPSAGLVMDGGGDLYGTTTFGGPMNAGTVFELTPPAIGKIAWSEKVLYSFTGGADGASPEGSVTLGQNGDILGTTSGAGPANYGTVFQLQPPIVSGGRWTEIVLYGFDLGTAGGIPFAGVIQDRSGNLYGTTLVGGDLSCNAGFNDGCGTAFELTPPAEPGGAWSELVLHSFSGGADGIEPSCKLFLDKSGALYGTTENGGSSSDGVVFKIIP